MLRIEGRFNKMLKYLQQFNRIKRFWTKKDNAIRYKGDHKYIHLNVRYNVENN